MKEVRTVPRVRKPRPKPSTQTGVKVNPKAFTKTVGKSSQPTPSTSVRFRDPAIKQMLREVSEAAGLSQRELIEGAVARDLLFRGARLVSDLEAAARRIQALHPMAYKRLVERSLVEFAEGESQSEPIRARARHSAPGVMVEEGLRPELTEALAFFENGLGIGEPETEAELLDSYENSGQIARSAPARRGGSV